MKSIKSLEKKRNKNTSRKIEREYCHQTLYQPLLQGQSKQYYSLFKRQNGECSHTLPSITEHEPVSNQANYFNLYYHGALFLNLILHALETARNGTTVIVTIEGISKLVRGLKNGKASGPDGIKKEHLSVNISRTATILAQIFQYPVNIGELTECWKIANVIPVCL